MSPTGTSGRPRILWLVSQECSHQYQALPPDTVAGPSAHWSSDHTKIFRAKRHFFPTHSTIFRVAPLFSDLLHYFPTHTIIFRQKTFDHMVRSPCPSPETFHFPCWPPQPPPTRPRRSELPPARPARPAGPDPLPACPHPCIRNTPLYSEYTPLFSEYTPLFSEYTPLFSEYTPLFS